MCRALKMVSIRMHGKGSMIHDPVLAEEGMINARLREPASLMGVHDSYSLKVPNPEAQKGMSGTGMIHRLMLIDDNAIDQKMYQRIIARSGRVDEVVTCLSAIEALDYLSDPNHPKIDVILLDINMPRLDGFQFLEEATARFGNDFAKLVVVMLTTSLDPRDAERARGFPVVRDFLNKPLTTGHLDQIVGYLADG